MRGPGPVRSMKIVSEGVAVRRAYQKCVRSVSARSSNRQHQSADLQALYRSPLTDSSRRPPPYHALRTATGRNPRQRFRLVSALFRLGAFATGCHWLRPLGSINAPSSSRRSVMRRRIWEHSAPDRTRDHLPRREGVELACAAAAVPRGDPHPPSFRRAAACAGACSPACPVARSSRRCHRFVVRRLPV
jgi:hypothetical protein